MFLFRLVDFAFRLLGSFFIVFLLQIQFDGRSLETYLNQFAKGFFVTKNLKTVSEDGVTFIRSFYSDPKLGQKKREVANDKLIQTFEKFTKRINRPSQTIQNPKDKNKSR